MTERPEPVPPDVCTSGTAADGSLALTVHGETLQLLPDRALCWPARRTLVVADIHFGKDDVFRRAGMALPQGAAAEDLARLSRLLASTSSERLLVLGDFVHGALAAGDDFPIRFAEWRARHRELAIEVVAGNHDAKAARGLRDWASTLRWHAEESQETPFVFRHSDGPGVFGSDLARGAAALPAGAGVFALAGHLHPVARLPVPGGRGLRVPVFWRRAEALILPAFGRLTGGYEVHAARGEQLWLAGTERVLALSAPRSSRA